MTDLRLQDLLFLSTFASLAIACPAEDDPGGEAGSGEPTTGGGTDSPTSSASTMSSMSSSASASTTASTSDPTTSDDVTTIGTSPTTSDTDASTSGPTSSTTMGLGLCEEFGMRAEECGVGTAVDLENYCDLTLNDAMVQGQECYDASVEVFVCALAVDCRTLMGGPAGSCPEEYEAAQTICGGGSG